MPDLGSIARLIERYSTGPATETRIPRLSLACREGTPEPMTADTEPSLHLVAAGSTWLTVCDRPVRQRPGTLFVSAVEMALGHGYAGPGYRGLSLRLDPELVAQMTGSFPHRGARTIREPEHVTVEACPSLLDALHRLLRLLDDPGAIDAIAPLIEREVVYRLLRGPAAAVIRRVGRGEERLRKVRLVAEWLRRHPCEPATIAELAAMATVSESTLHRHFRAVTGRTPIQFRKDLRLREARQRLIAGREPPKVAAAAVGYASVSQFSREYRRRFGTTPRRDAAPDGGILGAG